MVKHVPAELWHTLLAVRLARKEAAAQLDGLSDDCLKILQVGLDALFDQPERLKLVLVIFDGDGSWLLFVPVASLLDLLLVVLEVLKSIQRCQSAQEQGSRVQQHTQQVFV